MLDNRTRINSLLPRASVASPRLCRHSVGRSTRSKIRNEKIARKIKIGKMSSSEALKWLNWIPLAVRRLSHRCIAEENAIKGNIPQHFESFRQHEVRMAATLEMATYLDCLKPKLNAERECLTSVIQMTGCPYQYF